MFRRVILESWQEYIPYICFALIAGVFAIVVLRALLMSKADVNHLASMPLGQNDEHKHPHSTTISDTEQ